ncbi:enoyl-CoA hydratase/isomerase family protein [Salibacter sp.]|uniref:enoyl-CoA hydratase/isomerase family protein n=1 Tax=Salibacter sp. TaxID=2010995 RepID=UPI0028706AA3|nr:enoyl-CoA hydratase/isomerase family protein [Salibacter sp.]MDR9398228.1 enoyl-CoA hydratase/isomerase family protein [Salibacter sp.]MDR9487468.1 enoyl-CoA hydratase/isomerase family protein [Salibacter sp.]
MSDITQQGYVETTVKDGIGTIEFMHPASNSLPGKLLAELAQNITDAGKNDDIKVIVLKSAGERAFCAGASFDELLAIDDYPTGKKFFMGFANVINAARKCPKLIIGRIQGKAVGGGVGMASAVDYCLATKYASVKLSELAIGIGPFVVGPAVERKIGSAMSQMAINATEWRDAQWAQEKGLYADIYETTEELDEAVNELSGKLAAYNPEAMRHLKNVFWEGCEDWDVLLEKRAELSGELVLGEFTKNFINNFKNKSKK